jgi:hypothetical protein
MPSIVIASFAPMTLHDSGLLVYLMLFAYAGLQKNIAGKNCWCTVPCYNGLLELNLYFLAFQAPGQPK